MDLDEMAAWGAAGLLMANAVFQLALAAGVPWGHAAYGGRAALEDGRLPGPYRAISLVTVLVMGLFAGVVLAAGGVIGAATPGGLTTWVCRAAAVLFALNTLGNLASKSRIERWVMGGATACLAVLFGIVGFA